jgi:hypothetical protein
MEKIKVDVYYEKDNKFIITKMECEVIGGNIIVGSIKKEIPDYVNYEIFDYNNKKFLVLINPMHRIEAIKDYEYELFKETSLYAALEELKQLVSN